MTDDGAPPVIRALRCVPAALWNRLNGLPQRLRAQWFEGRVDESALAALLGDLLIANDQPCSEELLDACDSIWTSQPRQAVKLSEFRPAMLLEWRETRVAVWRGDITTLEVDCIVNAANVGGLGCFIPEHRCVDNVIHRAAGPRLRESCRAGLLTRPGGVLEVGGEPLLTPGFHLPSSMVMHVVGPDCGDSGAPTPAHEDALRACYERCLDAAVGCGKKSIAFCCISTGLFGYPNEAAARVAIGAVRQWLDSHPPGSLEWIVFDVFLPKDAAIYKTLCPDHFSLVPLDAGRKRESALATAWNWLKSADAVLICAGAGMSVKDASSNENVYVSAEDFALHYPWFVRWGYHTSYECMGMFADPHVPDAAKWGLLASHMNNIRYRFSPNEGYSVLRSAMEGRDCFVFTSNVDGCFLRSGFDPDRIYTPQGDWMFYQCGRPCRRDAFFPSEPMLRETLPHLKPDGLLPEDLLPRCKFCGALAMGNVRGGDWFLHTPHDAANDRFVAWMDSLVAAKKRLVVLEIGAGFNTPTVTRFPMELIAREVAGATLIRVNPTEPYVPRDLAEAGKAIAIRRDWKALHDLFGPSVPTDGGADAEDEDGGVDDEWSRGSLSFGGMGWRRMVAHLKL